MKDELTRYVPQYYYHELLPEGDERVVLEGDPGEFPAVRYYVATDADALIAELEAEVARLAEVGREMALLKRQLSKLQDECAHVWTPVLSLGALFCFECHASMDSLEFERMKMTKEKTNDE